MWRWYWIIVLDHALQMQLYSFLHIFLNFLYGIAYCDTSRKIWRIRSIIFVSLFDDDKKTIHLFPPFGELRLLQNTRKRSGRHFFARMACYGNATWLDKRHSASAATSSRQNAGISSTTRPQTRLPSLKAASLTQMPPALVISSLMPVEPVALRPRRMPAEM